MKKYHLLSILCAVTCLTLGTPSISTASEHPSSLSENSVQEVGWKKDEKGEYYASKENYTGPIQLPDGIYYLKDGYKQKGAIKVQVGQNILKYGEFYYFDPALSGRLRTGWSGPMKPSSSNSWYYFNTDGRLSTGWSTNLKGERFYGDPSDAHLFCNGSTTKRIPGYSGKFLVFDKQCRLVCNQVYQFNGKTYYLNADGIGSPGVVPYGDKMKAFNSMGSLILGKKGPYTINGKSYFLDGAGNCLRGYKRDPNTGKYYYAKLDYTLMKSELHGINGKIFYFNRYGTRVSNTRTTVDGKTYYFGSDGAAVKNKWITISGKKYYFNTKGVLVKDSLIRYNNRLYYVRTDGSLIMDAHFSRNGKNYWASASGALLTGWQKYGGHMFYFDPKTGAKMRGLVTINGGMYYLDGSGKKKTGLITTGGKTYYLYDDGTAKTGWLESGGKKFYFDPSSKTMVKNGWASDGTGYYYMGSDGSMQSNCWKQIGNNWYYLQHDGKRAVGWMAIDNYRYYFGSNGVMYTGVHVIDGVTYDFGSTGAIPLTGEYTIRVNRLMNCITIYRGGVPCKAIVCSTGLVLGWTPAGHFQLLDKLRWHTLDGPSYGQYCSHITPDILFHSVPYYQMDNHTLKADYYNKLGDPASAGCIRLTCGDAKWMYDNCPIGTDVYIYDDPSSPGPLGKPVPIRIPLTQNYDPTDPNL